jgi:signal transduction histidine kinase
MDKPLIARTHRNDPGLPGRKALAAFAAGLCVFAVVLAVVTVALREKLRSQIVGRDAAVLSSVALFEVDRARSSTAAYTGYGSGNEEESILEALLDVSRLDGVVALRVFDAKGNFLDAAPAQFVRGGIEKEDMESLRSLKPASHFHPQASLGAFFLGSAEGGGQSVPILEILVPVHARGKSTLEGVGQFILDGAPTQAAFAELDRNLARQAGLAFAMAFILGGGLMSWAFWRMHRRNLLLLARTKALAKANRELALRSRVVAIGAVTANLLHGLKNPLAALSVYVEERRRQGDAAHDEALEDAGQAVRRMGGMIEQSVSILGQDEGGERFDYTLAEIGEVALGRCAKAAQDGGVDLHNQNGPEMLIDNRRGNLLALAAVNLLQNAVEATPRGGRVTLSWTLSQNGNTAALTVTDTGPGLPENMRADPFRPVHSGKKGGSGVGLAIAAQLVGQMGGKLSMEGTGPSGTVFSIRFEKIGA